MSEFKYCPHCGVQIQIEKVTCPNCKGIQPTRIPSISPNLQTKFCVHCGESIDYYSELCIKCGIQQTVQIHHTVSAATRNSSSKNPVLAAILNVLIMGLGHLYLGNFMRGLGLFVTSSIIGAITFIFAGNDARYAITIVLWLFAGYDGYDQAKRYNLRREIECHRNSYKIS